MANNVADNVAKSVIENLKVVIIGLGLIGGSIARGLAAKLPDANVVAVGRNEKVLQQALSDGMISDYFTDIGQACKNADLIVIAVPSLSVKNILKELQPVLGSDTVVTDAASVKGEIIESVTQVFGSVPENFVPGHPIAGSEHSGYSVSTANLFEHKKVILTPLENTKESSYELVEKLWKLLGAEVISMTVKHHDEVLAATSHLPHLLAYALVDTLSQQGESEEIFRYAAGGFRDFTRIASSDPQMWHDIFMANGDATITVLDEYIEGLYRMRTAIKDQNSAELMSTFIRAKKSRDRFLAMFSAKRSKT
jgi:prephenate dehydrogenase